MTRLTKQQIEVAAKWWADAVSRPKFDNGDPSQAGGMAMAMAMLISKPVGEGDHEKFIAELSKRLEAEPTRRLGVDYHPDQILGDAMSSAGIPRSNAPWKTRMSFRNGGVFVCHGYGAHEQVLLDPIDAETN